MHLLCTSFVFCLLVTATKPLPMARINKIFASERIANVIFYVLNGMPCTRKKPAHVRGII
jgi:hypothetical protein